MSDYQHLELEQRGPIRWLWLNRPEARNALNEALIADLTRAFADIEASPETRVVVLAARGDVFCAGADLIYLRRVSAYTHAENHEDALKVARLFQAVHACSRPVLARVQGDAYGGGVGLAAACDLVIAQDKVNFGLSEVRSGIVAATLSPHLARAIGARQAARYLLTAEKFDAQRARQLGLVHEAVKARELDYEVERQARVLLSSSPAALAATKKLLADLLELPMDEVLLAATAKCIADARVSAEGREGMAAFLEKRAPSWVPRATKP